MAQPKAIENLFNKYHNRIYRLALSITRNEKDAEDIMQNTFIKIIKNLQSFRNKSSLSTWIYRITYNEALMYLRKKKSQVRLSGHLKNQEVKSSSGLFINWAKLPDESLLEKETKNRIDASIANMPIKYRLPLLLDNVERLSLKENAKVLGLNLNSLKTRLHRAHLLLKKDISDYYKDRVLEPEKKIKRCKARLGFLYDYAKGYLGKSEERHFLGHIGDCLDCKRFLGSYLKAIQITGALQCHDLPAGLSERIETFLLSKHHIRNGKEESRR